MLRSKFGLVLAAAAFAMGSLSAGAAASYGSNKAVQSAGAARRFEFRRESLWGGGSAFGNGRRFRRGWSNRHQQRLATKKHNQARHRRACRG
jgi:hypothetical protein